jgi:hypothetical protein
MKSVATKRFWSCFAGLPPNIQRQAERVFRLWVADPSHQSLEFKQVHSRRPIYSVRIGIRWRALGVRDGETVTWFWIGSHADYDKLLKRL